MTTQTLRPDGTVLNKDVAVTGAASIHAALSDDSDSSYVVFDTIGDAIIVSVDNFTIPAGAIVKQVRGRARCSSSSGGVSANIYVTDTTGPGTIVSVTAHASSSIGSRQTAWLPWTPGNDQARINGLALGVDATAISANSLRAYEGYIDVIYVEQPVVALGTIADPYTTSSAILATWANTLDSDGGGQTAYQLWVTDDNDSNAVVYDSGVVASSVLAAATGPLANGGEYTVHIKVAQTVNGSYHWSAEDTQAGILVDVDTADVDDITAVANDATASITVTVNHDATSEDWQFIEIERSDDAGVTWVPVRGATLINVADTSTASTFATIDYEAPNGVPVVYRARATWFDDGLQDDQPLPRTSPVTGDWVQTSTPASWESTDVWFKVPGAPSLNDTFCFKVLPSNSRPMRYGQFSVLGAARPVVVSDVRSSPDAQCAVQTESEAEADAFLAVVSEPVVLIQAPAGFKRWGSRYVAVRNLNENPLPGGEQAWNLSGYAVWLFDAIEVGAPGDPDAGVM